MKKISLLLTIAFTLFLSSVSAYAGKEPIMDTEKISNVIDECYPHLKDYYNAGLLHIDLLTEETLADGSKEYHIRYKFVKNYYPEDEVDEVLKEQYKDIYMMSKAGMLKDISIYRFVDKATGNILTNVAYNRNVPDRHLRRFRRR